MILSSRCPLPKNLSSFLIPTLFNLTIDAGALATSFAGRWRIDVPFHFDGWVA